MLTATGFLLLLGLAAAGSTNNIQVPLEYSANPTQNMTYQYGQAGLMMEYILWPKKAVHFSFQLFSGSGFTGQYQRHRSYGQYDYYDNFDVYDRNYFFVVEPGVQLEVLDWGGTGRPLVLLAGYLSAHAYDELAPKLTATHHVYAISRRGPESGYTAARSADDVLRVLEALDLRGVTLAGHSWGGQDLSTIGARHSDRVAGLVYINSAGAAPPADKSSFDAYRKWQLKAHGVAFPESELRQTFTVNPDGSLEALLVSQHARHAIFAGRAKPEYARITMPVLALFVIRDAVGQRHLDDLKKGVPHARIVEVPGGNFYLFVSNPDVVARELNTFAASLPRLPAENQR